MACAACTSAATCALVAATPTAARSTSARSTAITWPFLTRSPRSTRIDSMTPMTGLPSSTTRCGSIRQPSGCGLGAGAARRARTARREDTAGGIVLAVMGYRLRGSVRAPSRAFCRQSAAARARAARRSCASQPEAHKQPREPRRRRARRRAGAGAHRAHGASRSSRVRRVSRSVRGTAGRCAGKGSPGTGSRAIRRAGRPRGSSAISVPRPAMLVATVMRPVRRPRRRSRPRAGRGAR